MALKKASRLTRSAATALFMAIALFPSTAKAQLVPPGCAAPSICQSFSVPSITIAPGGSITYGDGAISTSPVSGGSTTPTGPAGGDLTGTYPNPGVGSLPAISGASLTGLTGANVVGNISGRAGSVAASGVDLSTVTSALAGKLSNSSGVPPGLVDLSTVTSALAGKLSSSSGVPTSLIDLSTVTSALAGKLSNASTVPAGLVDLSTVTSALAGKLSNSSGVPPDLVDLSTVTSALAGKLATNGTAVLATAVSAGGVNFSTITAALASISPAAVNLSTVTAALALKLDLAGGNMMGQLTTSSTVTVQGDQFSVGGSTLAVTGGFVGIGTPSPLSYLHVKDGVTSGLRRVMKLEHGAPATTGNGVYIEFAASTVDGFGAQVGSVRTGTGAGDLFVRTGGSSQAERLRVTDSGSVLLGSGVTQSTFSTTGALAMASGSSITLTGSNGFVSSQSSVTASGFFGNGRALTAILVSSCTPLSGTFSNTSYGVGFATVTMTTRGGTVILDLNAMVQNTNSNKLHNAAFAVDGAYTSPKDIATMYSSVTNTDFSLGARISVEGLSAASHTFAVLFKTSANTATVSNSSTVQSQFCAREIQ